MRIWSYVYQLTPRAVLSERAGAAARSGALIRVEFESGKVGFADLHPWTELGDAALVGQLASLSLGEQGPNRLARNSLQLARLDADARAARRSLWEKLPPIPASHFLLPFDEGAEDALVLAASAGFTRFKSKMPGDVNEAVQSVRALVAELRALELPRSLRLDFNSSLDAARYRALIDALGPDADCIDFVEDPVPWLAQTGFGELPSLPAIAVDFESSRAANDLAAPPTGVRIVKPAIQDWATLLPAEPAIRSVVTTYLDHPIGQAFAAWIATSRASSSEIHGLTSHLSYEENEFSERLSVEDARLVIPREGTGIGFDDLLQKQAWKELTLA